jgi:dipeptidyl aminopeptidase/acylaminoacyl peptidase
MPWDDVELYRAKLNTAGTFTPVYKEPSQGEQARMQPQWDASGALYYLSDRDGWWNLYSWPKAGEEGQKVTCYKAEIGEPAWHLGSHHYELMDDDTAVVVYTIEGIWRVAQVCLASGKEIAASGDWSKITTLRKFNEDCYLIAADAKGSSGIYRWESGSLLPVNPQHIESSVKDISIAQRLSIPLPETAVTGPNEAVHAFYYAPLNSRYKALNNELPPSIIDFHGGPTWQAVSSFSLKRQFWTSRGFAVIDVNYRGSAGFGRDYRQRLYGQWGITDGEDAAAVVSFAKHKGLIDGNRVAIVGASAGGFTVLSCLANSDIFSAGVNTYGVSDLDAMVTDTHKFESRYIGKLASSGVSDEGIEASRSPINTSGSINVPLLTLQGNEDKVVPPSQSREIVDAVKARGLPCAYIEFPGEQHGFRQNNTVKRAIEAELSFYLQIYGLLHPKDIDPVKIENWSV